VSAPDFEAVVVGGGVTGLSTLYALSRGEFPVRTLLLEGAPSLGGVIRTERVDGFLIDRGPDSFVAQKPEGRALCEELGLAADLITPRPEARRVYMRAGDGLRAMPDGMVLGLPTTMRSFFSSDFLSFGAKLRMGLDLVLPRGRAQEESIAEFVGRRFGARAVEVIAEPLLAGIHSGRADELSMNANFPMLVELERKHRSVIRGLRRASKPHEGGTRERAPAFWSLRSGMGSLIDALVAALPPESLRTDAEVRGLDTVPGGLRVRLADGGTVTTRAAVLAVRSHAGVKIVERAAPSLAAALEPFDYASSAIVFLAYARDQIEHPLDAFGFVSTTGSGRVVASTFVSSKLEARAPEGHVLLRAFLGGARDPLVLELSDAELALTARTELGALLGIRGEPLLERVYRYPRATPQMRLGHSERIARLRAAENEHGRIFVAGGGYEGVGIPECVRQGRAAAERVRSILRDAT
jgi:oxygen-dependent protoporphyrinogen oxidase